MSCRLSAFSTIVRGVAAGGDQSSKKALRYFESAEGTCTKSYPRQAQTTRKIGVWSGIKH
jgi:hypothetical protein